MVWPPIYSVSLTFAGCPLQLYLLRMFCSSVYRKISFRNFSKCYLIKAWLNVKSFFPVYCNTRKNIGDDQKPISSSCIANWTPQFQNFAIPPTWLSSFYNSRILLSLHYFLIPQFQTFYFYLITNLLFGTFWACNPTLFFLLRFLKLCFNYS